jgi:hypothetical protein
LTKRTAVSKILPFYLGDQNPTLGGRHGSNKQTAVTADTALLLGMTTPHFATKVVNFCLPSSPGRAEFAFSIFRKYGKSNRARRSYAAVCSDGREQECNEDVNGTIVLISPLD